MIVERSVSAVLVVDLGVGGQVAGAVAIFNAQLPGGFALGGEICRPYIRRAASSAICLRIRSSRSNWVLGRSRFSLMLNCYCDTWAYFRFISR
jgi:hypothetical protein